MAALANSAQPRPSQEQIQSTQERFQTKKESDVFTLSTLGLQEKTQKCRGKNGIRITMAHHGSEVNTYLENNINLGY